MEFITQNQAITSLSMINTDIDQPKASLRSRFLLHLIIVSLLFFVPPCSSQAWDGVVITQADYQGLQAVKQELIDPRGFLRSWNGSGLSACSGGWSGIKCAQGQVIVIQLPWKSLGGRISEKIGQLQALRKLSLHDNNLGGSIPMSLGLIPNLRGVQLFNNRLAGSIPASLGVSRFLQTLDLSNNLLSEIIPPNLADSSRLLRLNLSFNSLSGQIPVSLSRSSSLQFLALDHNNLSGPILDTWGSKSLNLRVLSLDHNSLSGPFPFSLCNLTQLQDLSFSHNRIRGTLPSELSKLTKIRTLDISSNSVSGHIPETLGDISSLTHLDLSQNKLTGEIPISISDLDSLSFFNVSYNNLSGPVPTLLSQKFNSTSFVGNLLLCGYSVSTPCPTLPSPSPEKERKSSHRNLSTKDIILIASGALLIVMLILVCVLCCLLRKKVNETKSKGGEAGPGAAAAKTEKGGEAEAGGETGGKLVHFDGPMAFTADDLLCATAEIMGKSTYGTVYKATLEDGSQVAVKRLREKITKSQKEFENEINVLGRIRHPNLLALRAYYLGPKGEKLVVFDYMSRGSLATFLHARGPDVHINWPTRMSLIKGMARGLFYLHTHANIIHGNLTSSNVLLDENINAKISDYGLSRLMTAAAGSSVIATAGALGYRAPELSKLKKANTKTDMYSLGVIILELLTGKSPSEALNGVDLPQWVATAVKEEWTNEVFDLELLNDVNTMGDEILNTLKLALHCVDPTPSTRPEAQQVMTQLGEIRPEETATTSEPLIDVPEASASTIQ
ncbi:Leucine-rich repeat-containing N-terminal plant-type [Arabidopsis thaliana x Arabidopsis arenosa]|uniref:non-specific serine/threonine protein kinase n=1 Tax=Arabidopsis thaliana x Arabidopsis arenosa TaxID=1240361 RepID=A0A8T1ZPS0_9BRAS|nr:Leucine-rich repeat-containing N-terminal plant-type [Arabidopsis thaliana x Arabidopsis arenosa]